MEGMSETLMELWGQVSALRTCCKTLEDVRKSCSFSPFEFAAGSDDFFFILHCKKPRQTSLDLEARRKLSTPHSTPPASLCRLAGSLTTHKEHAVIAC